MTVTPAVSPQKSVGQIYCVCALIMSEIHPPLPVENNTKKFRHTSEIVQSWLHVERRGKVEFVVIQLVAFTGDYLSCFSKLICTEL